MRRLIEVMYLRLKLIFTNWKQLLSFFLLPLVVFIGVDFFYKETVQEAKVPIALIDLDKSKYSETIVNKLNNHNSIRIVPSKLNTYKQIVLKSQVDSAIVIKKDFKKRLDSGEKKLLIEIYYSNSSLATPFIKEIIASQVMRSISNLSAADRVVEKYEEFQINDKKRLEDIWLDAWNYNDGQWEPIPLMTIKAKELYSYENKLEIEVNKAKLNSIKSSFMFVSAMMMFFVFTLSHWLLDDQAQNINKRLFLSPITTFQYFLGNSLATIFVSSIQMMIMIFLLLFKVEELTFLPLICFYFIYMLCCTFIGVFITAFCQSIKQVLLLNIFIVVISTIFALGFPTSYMTGLSPQHWLITGMISSIYDIIHSRAALILSLLFIAFFLSSFMIVRWKYATNR